MIMVGFALSCFGLLLFLWLAFGGPVPLKPKGYQFKVVLQGGRAAGQRGRRAHLGRLGRQGQGHHARQADGHLDGGHRARPRATRRSPKDTKATLRQKTLLGETYVELTPGNKSGGTVPENGSLPAGSVAPTVELDEIFRAFDQKTRDSFRIWMRPARRGGQGPRAGHLRRAGQPRAVRRGHHDAAEAAQRPAARRAGLVRNTGEVFAALSERDGQLQSLITNSNKVFATTAQRNQALKAHVHRAADLPARVADHVRPPDRRSPQTRTRWSPSCAPPRASCRRRWPTSRRSRPTSRRCSATSTRSSTRR